MKFIEDIRGKHKGEEIWVVGAGSSLDAYPLSFFGDKICVAMNYVFSVFIDIGDGLEKFSFNTLYSVHEHRPPADWLAKHKPTSLKHCFFLLPPKRRGGSDAPLHLQMVWWEDYNNYPYYMNWGLKGKGGVSASTQDFEEVAKCINSGEKCYYVCRGTTLHWAIQAAAVLGAKKIYIVGGEARGPHMHKHGSMYKQGGKHRVHPQWISGTKNLADAFRPYGVEIVYYYYGKGEQKP